ncbi:glutaminase family protein [Paenibacillus cremeus]|uniref:DUF4965 domain-containing protein n=1 Tax=Paenibacillus cremeus TaxID=2163881 RepID=A0A559KG53_9BACL|nr:glutaminase family protein [Paenibacillus cremeus]TVY11096.1 DUF4965 domain-containing protein [Paenibacillus cremeus]
MTTRLRPPSVPLVTVDPYFNIWSSANQLHENETKHWTGKNHSMVGMARIDGQVWRFMGGRDHRSDFITLPAEAMEQTDLIVKPLTTVYTFEAGGVKLKVEFTTPLLLDDLDVLSRPASYVTIGAVSSDGKPHQVEIYYDLSAELCVDAPIQEVVSKRFDLEDGSQGLQLGTEKQQVLWRSGDDLRIDWGYATLLVPSAVPARTAVAGVDARSRFASEGAFPEQDDNRFPRPVHDDMPVLACVIDYGQVGSTEVSHYLVLAYDDVMSVEYFHQKLPGYWSRNGRTFPQMLAAAVQDYAVLMGRCAAFDERLIQDAAQSGGTRYADILALSYRQAIAAHKLVADENGEALFFSKENFSNGCMATVDVSYPSIPLFLLYNVELVKGMMRPVYRYSASEAWPFDFAPHDVGRYPLANGQAYGMKMERQMPIEECGNMLIMAAAVSLAEGHADFAAAHWELLTGWVHYLLEYGMDPGNQLCTDDFGGHLAHNTNLSIKAIMGIAGYGLMCGMLGKNEEKEQHLQKAREMAQQWEQMAAEGDHYLLAFDAPGTWSMKYNLVWDTLFDLHLFSPDVRKKEVATYLQKMNQYGTPLDNRKTYTKADWLLWVATLADHQADFEALVSPLWDFLNESSSRVPFTDWYYTIDGRLTGFINRSVVGGLFIKLLKDQGVSK